MDYIKLHWDSDFLGFNVCRIINNKITDKNKLSEILYRAKSESYRLCYLIFPSDNKILNEIAQINNGLLVDEKIIYSISDFDKMELIFSDEIIEYNNNLNINALYDLAIQSSHQSRFRFDKNFDKKICDNMYRIWVDNSITGKLANKIYVFIDNEKIKGMITIGINNNIGEIGLLGVDENERGKKIGKKLIHKTFSYLLQNNVYELKVSTQLRNISACKFYEKCGFKISNILLVYHFWL